MRGLVPGGPGGPGEIRVMTKSPPRSTGGPTSSSRVTSSMALLRPAGDGWSAGDWQAFYDERAGIAEFDGGLPRAEAEAQAFACCLAEWQSRNLVRSSPGRCLRCGSDDHTPGPILPYGMESTGLVWLHSRCWPAWQAGRKAAAAGALAGMGIGRQP